MATLRRIDPLGGDPTDLDYWRQSWRLWNAGSRRQYGPEANQVDADTLLEHRRRTGDRFAHVVATERDVVVGRLDLVVNPRDEAHLAIAQLEVMPPWRGQGLGHALWAEAESLLAELGVSEVEAISTVPYGADEEHDPSAHLLRDAGFHPTETALISELDLSYPVPVLPVPAGYRLDVIRDVPPDALMATLAELNQQLDDDEPRTDAPARAERWTEASLRGAFQRAASLGLRFTTVLAVAEDTGEVVGMSENSWTPSNAHVMHQGGTYVKRGHRGQGLATAAKSRAIAAMKEIAHGALVMRTTNAEDNVTMHAVNDAIGFKPTHLQTEWRRLV